MEESHVGFGLLRIRVLGLEEFRAKHGPQSVVPFLRTAAHTLRHSLDAENFLGCWGENEFLAVLPSASPVTVATTAETLWNLLSHSEVLWWGDRFPIESEVAYTVATAGQRPGIASREMKPSHSSATAKAAAAGAANDSEHFARMMLRCFRSLGSWWFSAALSAGYLMEHGNIKVLLQPAELIIIGGAAVGTVLISNPIHTLKADDQRRHWGIWVLEVQHCSATSIP